MFELAFLFIVSSYFLLVFFVLTGTRKKFPQLNSDALPSVTVIVAARNEEINIKNCIESLSRVDYPGEKLEIIIVDDESSDATRGIAAAFIKERNNFKIISSLSGSPSLKGKVKAIAAGIQEARGEIILLTDADCTVPEKWVYLTASYFTPGTGVVNGFTVVHSSNSFTGMQAYDFIFLLSVACGSTNRNFPVSCMGNNMAFTKEAYLAAGGYENLPFSVTEDFALLSAIRKTGKYKIIHPVNIGSLVISKPETGIAGIYSQKKRWAAGAASAPAAGLLFMSTALLANLFTAVSPLFFSTVSLYLAVFKIAVDAFFLYPVLDYFKIKKNPGYFLSFQIYYIIYIILLPFILLFSRKIRWKGREYSAG